MTTEKKSAAIEMIKVLRQETGVSIGLCNEAVKEANENLEEARKILRQKCIQVGEKFYNNPEKKILFSATSYKDMERNHLHIVKIGCQSDFLIASSAAKKITDYLIFKRNFAFFNEKEQIEIEDEMKYQAGLVKENIQVLCTKKLDKKEEDAFYIFSNATTSNPELFNGVTVVTYTGTFHPNEDQHHLLSINIHSFLKKKIVNIEEENSKKALNYSIELNGNELEEFLAGPMITDKTKSINNFLKEISDNVKILNIFSI